MDIIALPEEAITHIVTFLNVTDIYSLRLSCKKLQRLTEESYEVPTHLFITLYEVDEIKLARAFSIDTKIKMLAIFAEKVLSNKFIIHYMDLPEWDKKYWRDYGNIVIDSISNVIARTVMDKSNCLQNILSDVCNNNTWWGNPLLSLIDSWKRHDAFSVKKDCRDLFLFGNSVLSFASFHELFDDALLSPVISFFVAIYNYHNINAFYNHNMDKYIAVVGHSGMQINNIWSIKIAMIKKRQQKK